MLNNGNIEDKNNKFINQNLPLLLSLVKTESRDRVLYAILPPSSVYSEELTLSSSF